MKRTYICGNCNARFSVTDLQPLGCPCCHSDRITALTNRLSTEDSVKKCVKGIEDTGRLIAELETSKKNLIREYTRYRNTLYQHKLRGNYKGDILTYKDFM